MEEVISGFVFKPRSKLNDDQIKQVKQMLDDGISQAEIARVMGVSSGTIWHIANPDKRKEHWEDYGAQNQANKKYYMQESYKERHKVYAREWARRKRAEG